MVQPCTNDNSNRCLAYSPCPCAVCRRHRYILSVTLKPYSLSLSRVFLASYILCLARLMLLSRRRFHKRQSTWLFPPSNPCVLSCRLRHEDGICRVRTFISERKYASHHDTVLPQRVWRREWVKSVRSDGMQDILLHSQVADVSRYIGSLCTL